MSSTGHTDARRQPHKTVAAMRSTALRRMAPAAPPHPDAPKVLRIGVIQGGRITEEQVIRRREDVTVGQSEKNVFVIPHPKLPGRYVLFEIKGGKYFLNAREFMEGKISSPQGIRDLAAMRSAASIPLDEKARGKIVIGDTTLLFQFVFPPPVQPRPQLPAALKGGWFKGFVADWFFNLMCFMALVAHVGPLVYVTTRDWPVEEKGFDLDNKFLQLVVQAPTQEDLDKMLGKKPEKTDDGTEAAEEETKGQEEATTQQKGSKGPKVELSAEQKAAMEAERRAKMEAQLNNMGALAVLGSNSNEATGNGGANMISTGMVDGDIDDIMSKVSGTKIAGLGDGAGGGLRTPAGGGGGGKIVAMGGLNVNVDAVATDSGTATEKKVKGTAKVGAGEDTGVGTGVLDAGSVKKELNTRATAFKMCYEKALNVNAKLSGKLSIKFTISESGRVTKATIITDEIKDPSVTSCVLEKVKSITFAKPQGGSVEFIFPFVFKSSEG